MSTTVNTDTDTKFDDEETKIQEPVSHPISAHLNKNADTLLNAPLDHSRILGDDFYRPDDTTNSIKALKEVS